MRTFRLEADFVLNTFRNALSQKHLEAFKMMGFENDIMLSVVNEDVLFDVTNVK